MSVHIKIGVFSTADNKKKDPNRGNGVMMVNKKWKVTIDEETHIVEYKCVPILGKIQLTVDGESFAVQGKPFGIGLERREMVLVGSTQGVLGIKRGGSAELMVRDGEAQEI
jgi:hypothetical protein